MTMRTPRPPGPEQIKRQHAEVDGELSGSVKLIRELQQRPKIDNAPLIVGGLVLFVLILLVMLVRSVTTSTVAEVPTVIASPVAVPSPIKEIIVVTAAPPPATPTQSCVAGQPQLALIEAMEKRSDWKQASATAEAALDIANLCDGDRRALTQKAVADGLNVLYYTAVDGQDRAGQQYAVDRFLALKQRARDARVDFPSSLQVATQAFQISQFRLAIAAIEKAYAEQEFDPLVNRQANHLYVSALYSIGFYYTKTPPAPDLYNEGLAYLSASHKLAVQYQTGQGEAAILLTQLLGSDETTWSKPYKSPLLVP